MKSLPTILAALMMPIAAQAANIRPIKPGHVFVQGEIVTGDLAKLRKVVKAGDYIWLDSVGGNVLEGLLISNYIRQNSLKTGVADGMYCASICVSILAGGVDRIVAKDARVAVHSAGTPKGEDIATQGITLLMARHISRMGAPDTVVAKIVTTENSSVYQLTAADMKGWVR